MRDSCSPPVRSSNLRGKQNRHPTEYRNFVEFLPRPCRWGLSDLVHWLRPKPAELAPFLSGANTLAERRIKATQVVEEQCPVLADTPRQIQVSVRAYCKAVCASCGDIHSTGS